MASVLFTPFALRGSKFANRIVVAPMCQYSAVEGTVGDWHLMHLGHIALSGPGLLIIEATGVSPNGRITPNCTGLYSDRNESALKRVVEFCRGLSGTAIGIQLCHSGRKGSTRAPWLDGGVLTDEEGYWVPEAPSSVPYLPTWEPPLELDESGLRRVQEEFVQAARRAARIGLDLVELHMAHGYLLHSFLSPLTNKRTDGYGGSPERRMRFPLEVFEAVRGEAPPELPVTVRLSATDWVEGGWDVEQSTIFCRTLNEMGCDMVHVTSGGLVQEQKIRAGPGYQIAFSEQIRREANIATLAVGQIMTPSQAETIIRTGQADMAALARGILWDPRWVWKAALELGAEIELPPPYARCNPKLASKPFVKRH